MSGGARKSGGHGFNTDPTLHTQHSKGFACSHAEQAHAQDIFMLHKMHCKNTAFARVRTHRHNLDMHHVFVAVLPCHKSRAGEGLVETHISDLQTQPVWLPQSKEMGWSVPQGEAFAFNVGNLGSIPSYHRSPRAPPGMIPGHSQKLPHLV